MKRATKTIFILLFAFLCAVPAACRPSENGSFAATPAEEYARVSSLAGEGKIFDIDSMTSFEVQHNASYRADCIASDDGDGIANVSAIYQYSHLGDVYRSYAMQKTVWNFAADSDTNVFTPEYTAHDPRGYQSDGYHWGAGQTVDTRPYPEILSLRESPETVYRKTLTLPAADLLENFDGGKSGNTYTVMVTVKAEGWDGFEQWMQSFYYYLSLYSLADGKQVANFFDFHEPHSARLTVRSTRTMLTDVVLQLETYGKYDMGPMRFEAKTTFKSGGVSVQDIGR